MTAPSNPGATDLERLSVDVQGMNCASCVSRVERALNALEGVHATVNLATERANVEYDPARASVDEIAAAVASTGYRARMPAPPAPTGAAATSHAHGPSGGEPAMHEGDAHHDHHPTDAAALASLRRRVLGAAILTVPLVAISMIPPLQFDYWQWAALALATPIVLWAGWPLHEAALRGLRHRTTTMDTLISIGTVAAWGWSVYALL